MYVYLYMDSTCASENAETCIVFSRRIADISASKSSMGPRVFTKCPFGYWESISHESIRTTIL